MRINLGSDERGSDVIDAIGWECWGLVVGWDGGLEDYNVRPSLIPNLGLGLVWSCEVDLALTTA